MEGNIKEKCQCLKCGRTITKKEFEVFDGLCPTCYLSILEQEEGYELFQIIDEDDYED